MRSSRGMGAIKKSKIPGATPSKMPTKKIIHRKDDPNRVELYKEGGQVMAEKWIQKAIKKPGALKESLGVKKGEKIPAKKLAAAAKKPGKMGQRARLAETCVELPHQSPKGHKCGP